MKYQDVSRSKDSDFQALSERCKEQILQGLQVNLSVAGDSQSGLSAESANMIRLFHEHTVRPLTEYIQRVLNRELFSYYENINLSVGLEIVLTDDEDEIAIMANKIAMLNAGIISRNEIRSELELEPIDGGDILTISTGTGIVTLSSVASGGSFGIDGSDYDPENPTGGQETAPGDDLADLDTISPDSAHATLLGAIKYLSDKVGNVEDDPDEEEIPQDKDEPETDEDEINDEEES